MFLLLPRPSWQDGDTALRQRFIFAEADWKNIQHDIKRAVRHLHYKLHYDRLTKRAQLYDLLSDPGEKTDISGRRVPMEDLLLGKLQEFMRINEAGQPLGPLSPEEIDKLKSFGYLQ